MSYKLFTKKWQTATYVQTHFLSLVHTVNVESSSKHVQKYQIRAILLLHTYTSSPPLQIPRFLGGEVGGSAHRWKALIHKNKNMLIKLFPFVGMRKKWQTATYIQIHFLAIVHMVNVESSSKHAQKYQIRAALLLHTYTYTSSPPLQIPRFLGMD